MLLDAVCYLSLATYCSLAELFLPHTSLFSFVVVPYNHDIAQKCYEISRVTSVSRMIIFKHSLLMGSQPRLPWKSIRDSSKLPAEIMSGWTHAWAGSIDSEDLLTGSIGLMLGLHLLTVWTGSIDSEDLNGIPVLPQKGLLLSEFGELSSYTSSNKRSAFTFKLYYFYSILSCWIVLCN